MIFFDPLQMLTTPYAGELLNVDAITLKRGIGFTFRQLSLRNF